MTSQKYDLVGTAEIAKMLDVTSQRVHQLRMAEGFPTPVGTLTGDRRIWKRADIERWAKRTGREIKS